MKPSDLTVEQLVAIDDCCRAMFQLPISSVTIDQLTKAATAAGVEWK